MNRVRLLSALVLAGVLAACSMPQPMPMPMPPSSPSSPSGAPAPSMPMPSPSEPGSSSPSESSSSPSEGGAEGSGDPSSSPSGGEPASGAGQPLPPGGEGDMGDLDAQLDEALEDFDESMSGEGEGSTSGEIDILNPMGASSSGIESDEPIYEEAGMDADGTPSENDEIAERAASGAPPGGEMSEGEETSGAQSQAGEGGAAAPESSEGRNSGSTAAAGDEGDANIIPIPDDIGDGRDDDIVMRQIREAAMKEQNPELREKLWDEYRRIRGQR